MITLAFIASTGATLPYGGAYSNALGYGVVFRGTCDSRPYQRGVRLGHANGGGYGFAIPAGATYWECWTGFNAVNQWFSVALYDADNVPSNFVSWYRN